MADDNIQAVYPLTAVQEGLLLHTIDGKRSGAYFEQYACDLHGTPDIVQLRAAWQQSVDRHDVLRTLFTWEGRDRPLQLVRKRVQLPWTEHDWQSMPQGEQQRRWQLFLADDRSQGFALDSAPLLRVQLIALAPACWRMLVSFHHVLMDAWSLQILLDEVWQTYRAACDGKPDEWAKPLPYADFVAWSAAQDREQGIAFWRAALDGYAAVPAPSFGPAPPAPTQESATTLRRDLAPDRFARIEQGARRERVTLGCCVAGAWAVLLARYAGQSDVAFGYTSAGRPAELEGAQTLVGLCMNTPPLRVRIDPLQEPGPWLRALLALQVQMRAFEHTPLVDIHRASGVPAGQSLFDTVLVVENAPMHSQPLGHGRQVEVRDENYLAHSHYPLALIVIPGKTLSLRLVFDPGRYDEAAMHRVLDHMEQALDALCDASLQRLRDIEILPPHEADRVAGAAPRPGEGRTIVEAMRVHVATQPQVMALVDGNEQLTWADFAQRTDVLAGRLQALGAGPGVCVPICATRSASVVLAMVAVLKAGAAHVVIDAGLPPARIDSVLADLAAGVAAGSGTLAGFVLVDDAGMRVLALPPDAMVAIDVASRGAQAPDPVAPPAMDDPAYLIYTSGSTGAPKGVVLTHRNLSASLLAREVFYPSAPQRYLLLSSIATDSAIAGVYWPLFTGGTLVVAPQRIEQDPLRLVQRIDVERISHLLCLPSLWEAVLEQLPQSGLGRLRVVVVAGEACPPALVDMHHARLPHVALYNEYGPAEAAVWSTAIKLDPGVVARAGCVPIGHAISTAAVSVRDAHGRPCPQGIAGELCIAGAGLARGYWKPDPRDAARFADDPQHPGSRLYRSGDLGRQLPDGAFAFLGRIDNQVKIRGYRVEPEEVERVLARHPDLREVVVVAAPHAVSDEPQALCQALSALPPADAQRLLSLVETMQDAPPAWASGARSLS